MVQGKLEGKVAIITGAAAGLGEGIAETYVKYGAKICMVDLDPNVDKTAASTNAVVQAAVEREEALLGDTGRVLLRPSGTEPLVRVMAEAATQQQADEVCARLAQVVADELAL